MSERTHGAPLAKEVVRALRERAGLSQEALANRLGLAGKAVVSGWETGRTSCEGPAAELLLHLFAADTSRSFGELSALAEATWRRAATWCDTWRQISAVPETPLAIERDVFANLFPGVAAPSERGARGFPFVELAGAPVFGIGSTGWSAAIPHERDRAPRYLWQLDRAGGFLYREVPWEEDLRASRTAGHTHVGSLLELAAATTAFLRRLALTARTDRDARHVLRLDLEGMHGRGIASIDPKTRTTDLPKMVSNEHSIQASMSVTMQSIVDSPLAISTALVAELLLSIRPELAPVEQLSAQLAAFVSDQ